MPPLASQLLNVVNYGALADGRDCAPAYQAAVDDLLASGKPGVIYTPAAADTYKLHAPVLCDAPFARFLGDGPDQSVIQSTFCWPPLTFGVKRNSLGVPLTLDHYVSTTLVLDSTAAGKWALKTKGDAHVGFVGSPFDCGPADHQFWGGTNQFTVDFAVAAAPFKQDLVVCGLMDKQKPSPWFLFFASGFCKLAFAT